MQNLRSFVTIVSGVPRSGTSLMMQMLAAGGMPVLTDEVRRPDGGNPRGYYELEAVKATARDSRWVGGAEGRAVKVIHALASALPSGHDYRFIVLRRPIDEVMRSQRRMLGADVDPITTGKDDALGRTFQAQLDRALREMRDRPRAAVLELDYRELVASPREQSARVDAFLGGGLDIDAMVEAVDPGLYRSRSPR